MKRGFGWSHGLVLLLAAYGLSGAGGGLTCGGASDQTLCTESGGTWGTPTNWPAPCGDDPALAKGAAVPAGENACVCPADKPNWADGRGCEACAITYCRGEAVPCNRWDNVGYECETQEGCKWHYGYDRLVYDDDGDSHNEYVPPTCYNESVWSKKPCRDILSEQSCKTRYGCTWTK